MRVVALLALGLVATSAAAAPPVIGPAGVGGLRLGMTLAQARSGGLVGPPRPGCELQSPRPLVAALRAPLVGSATFTRNRLAAVELTGGARTAKGVGVGSTWQAVARAYPGATVFDARPGDPLQLHELTAALGGHTVAFWFDRHGGRVKGIAVPALQACE